MISDEFRLIEVVHALNECELFIVNNHRHLICMMFLNNDQSERFERNFCSFAILSRILSMLVIFVD